MSIDVIDVPAETEHQPDETIKKPLTDIVGKYNQIAHKYSESLKNLKRNFEVACKKEEENMNCEFAQINPNIWNMIKEKKIKGLNENYTIECAEFWTELVGDVFTPYILCTLSNGAKIRIAIDVLKDYKFID